MPFMKGLQNRSQFVAQIVKISQHANEITSLNDREVRHITFEKKKKKNRNRSYVSVDYAVFTNRI